MLETPPTIRLPTADELPNQPELFEKLKGLKEANIVEGYKLRMNTTHDLPFTFYAEVNIDNSRLWNLFQALAKRLPDIISCIYNLYEEEAACSNYKDKSSILSQLENYKLELTQDCTIEFGLIYHSKDMLEEVFVSESKYLRVWGNNESAFRDLMDDFNLNEVLDLNFIDEFPKVVEPLRFFNENTKEPSIIIAELNNFFRH